MSRHLTRAIGALAVLALLAGCRAPEEANRIRWEKPNTDETQQLKDEGDCRRRAESEVERESRRDRLFGDDGLARPGSFDAAMTRYDAGRRIERLAAECLRRKGYAPATR